MFDMHRDVAADLCPPVAIVGAGPVGLALALGLARHGVRSIVLEKEARTSARSKAPGIHARTLEILRQWGVDGAFLRAGTLVRQLVQHDVRPGRRPLASYDLSELADEAEPAGVLILEQAETERLLLEAVRSSGLSEVRFGAEVVSLVQGRDGVTLTIREGHASKTVASALVVGCDGAGSFVRSALGLPFEGITYRIEATLADIRVRDRRDALPWPRFYNGRGGMTFAVRLSPGLWRVIRIQPGTPDEARDVPAGEVAARVAEVLPGGPCEIVWANRFRIHRRSSPRFRVGRVLLAGDAAHVHSPIGGQGMNSGIQDAHNLAWKIAAALRGADTERLLASYEEERCAAVVGTVTRFTDVLTRVFLQTPVWLREAAFFVVRQVLRIAPLRRRVLRRLAMLDSTYPASALLEGDARARGRRLPNVLLRAPDGARVRLHDRLPDGPAIVEVARHRSSASELPVAIVRIGPGALHDPTGRLYRLLDRHEGWILVRPDRHIAWARTRRAGLEEAVAHALGARPRAGLVGFGAQ